MISLLFLCYFFINLMRINGNYRSLQDIRDSISAEIEMRTNDRPVIYLFSPHLAEQLIPHIRSYYHLKSSDISCFNLLSSSTISDDLNSFALSRPYGSIAVIQGIESLTSSNVTKLNFLHSIADSVSRISNLYVILIWNPSVGSNFPTREQLYHHLTSTDESLVNSRALIGRITRIESMVSSSLINEQYNPLELLCKSYGESDWTYLYIIVTVVTIIGSIFLSSLFTGNTDSKTKQSSPQIQRQVSKVSLQKKRAESVNEDKQLRDQQRDTFESKEISQKIIEVEQGSDTKQTQKDEILATKSPKLRPSGKESKGRNQSQTKGKTL